MNLIDMAIGSIYFAKFILHLHVFLGNPIQLE